MAKRSLKASPAGIAKAKQVFERREWTQEYLASAVGLQTRQSIWKFFTGRPIERYLFIDICFQLDLDWEEMVDRPPFDNSNSELLSQQLTSTPVESLKDTAMLEVQNAWEMLRPGIYEQLQAKYQSVQDLLDIYQPVDLAQIYTELMVHTYTQSWQWLEAEDLHHRSNYAQQADLREMPIFKSNPAIFEKFDRENFSQPEQTLDLACVVRQRRRVILLGQVGAGKSFLLRSLALQFSSSEPGELPLAVYIPLWQLESALPNLEAADSLAAGLLAIWADRPQSLAESVWSWLLESGKVLLLLDGLDTITTVQRPLIHQIIQRLAQDYPEISIVVASRLGGADTIYPSFFPVTVRPLSDSQIQQFVGKWFSSIAPIVSPNQLARIPAQEIVTAFLKQLFDKRNRRLHDLAQTPLLLHLLCLTFCDRQQLPQTRSRLYEYIFEIFLVGWDRTRNLRREASPWPLSKDDLIAIFSQVAFSEFEAGRIFFERPQILSILAHYITQQSQKQIQPEAVWQISHSVLDHLLVHSGLLVESAKGVYTFSHQAFQEYLCARYIATSIVIWDNSRPAASNCILEPRWHEVILLTLEISPQRDQLLRWLYYQLNQVVVQCVKFNQFLEWIDQKAQIMSQQLKDLQGHISLRAFYFGSWLDVGLDLFYDLDTRLAWQLPAPLAKDLNLIQLTHTLNLFAAAPSIELAIHISFVMQTIQSQSHDLNHSLRPFSSVLWQKIQSQTLESWNLDNLQTWARSCQLAIVQISELGDCWQWTDSERMQLEQYYWANIFLLECCQKQHNQGDRVGREIRLNLLKPRLVNLSRIMPNQFSIALDPPLPQPLSGVVVAEV